MIELVKRSGGGRAMMLLGAILDGWGRGSYQQYVGLKQVASPRDLNTSGLEKEGCGIVLHRLTFLLGP